MTPDVSVVMPLRNAERYVYQAVRSVLDQTFESLELIVVDDGSTDGSRQRVAEAADDRVRIVDGPVDGIARALNRGLEEARGSILCRCDADDLYLPGRLETQVRWLKAHPEFGAVCGRMVSLDVSGRKVAELDCGGSEETEITEGLLRGEAVTSLCTFAVRAEVMRKTGGCRPYFVVASDVDLQFRIAEAGRVGYLPEAVYAYRVHDGSHVHVSDDGARRFYDDMARSFALQRREGGRDDLQKGTPPPVPETGRMARPAQHQIASQLNGRAWRLHGEGNKKEALRAGWAACRKDPWRLKRWMSLVALLIKPSKGGFGGPIG
ncbi:MAG: glycosyltransferase family A protein [Phycisphaeraceae bacterium]|nr:glycosyltransferase family A protein [Phycisphaeraceae bacterium]